MYHILRGLLLMAVSVSALAMAAADSTFTYIPQIHATLRPRLEVATESGEYRFQMRNARLVISGYAARPVDYFINIDLCDRGKMKILDAWGRLAVSRQFRVQAGQFRMPFGIDPFRAPHQYYFANRSFIGKQMCNYRSVGAKLDYMPVAGLNLEFGVFNPTAIGDHEVWSKKLAYAGRAVFTPGAWKFATGYMSIRPHGVRANLIDATAGWSAGRWIVEGEYMYKHYVHASHVAAHAYSIFADYRMPIHAGYFNRLSFQGRFDGLTDHSDSSVNADGLLYTTDHARNRITVGSTISYIHSKSVFVDFRVDYEKYFYSHGFKADAADGDRIVAELVFRF